MYQLLIVDDEQQIIELVRKYAEHEGYKVISCLNGKEAIDKVKNHDIDLIIMDIMMPVLDGFSAVKEIKKFSKVPIIMLSARSEEYDKLYGFDLGIDDYVTKPFSPKELMMRVNAILNRYYRKNITSSDVWTYDTLKIDLDARIVYVDDVQINLTLKEYEILVILTKNKNIVVTREKLLNDVWDNLNGNDDRTLDTHIKSLRRKIGKYSDNIITLRRVGYRFEAK